ncbi:hypothetical protein INT44_001449, partial [Umbelopsis vinacea]
STSSDVPQLTGAEEGSSQTNNEPPFSLPTSAAGTSSNWASNVNVSQPPIEMILPERGSSETINLGASAPRKTADGLTVVTVGHLAPKNTPPGTFGYPVLSASNSSQETSVASTTSGAGNGKVRVHRTTYVPGWSVPPRVLLVDDDSVFRNLSSKLLQVFGCTFDVAADGVEAMHKLGLEKYDIVLMDIVMPNLDGVSATRNIRQYDTMTPIISMTSNTTDSDIMEYIGSGMTDVLPKPFSKQSLYDMLDKYCAHLKAIQRHHGIQQGQIPRSLGELGLPAISMGQLTESAALQDQSSKTDTNYAESSNSQNAAASSLPTGFFNFAQFPPQFTNFLGSLPLEHLQEGQSSNGQWQNTSDEADGSDRSQKKRKTAM